MNFADKFKDIFQEFACRLFGYDRLLPSNTGVEGGEVANKLARKWGYLVKGIPRNAAVTVFCHNNFWGRTLAAISSSNDSLATQDHGPLLPGFKSVPFSDLPSLSEALGPDSMSFVLNLGWKINLCFHFDTSHTITTE